MMRPQPDQGDLVNFGTLQIFRCAEISTPIPDTAIKVHDELVDGFIYRAAELGMHVAELCLALSRDGQRSVTTPLEQIGALGELVLDDLAYRRLIKVLVDAGAVIEGRADLHGQLAFSDVEFLSACRQEGCWQAVGILSDLTCEVAEIHAPGVHVQEGGFDLRVFGPSVENLCLMRDQLREWAGLPTLEADEYSL